MVSAEVDMRDSKSGQKSMDISKIHVKVELNRIKTDKRKSDY